MSNKQIEMALVSLVPTYGADLPPSLVELAGSLLALSRHLASTLKAEEEIARLYACAHIACERLKMTLDLPPIAPRPPIPPRVYKRLHAHLDNVLPHGARSQRRGRAPRSAEERALPSRPTPSRETSLAQFRGPTGSHAKKAPLPQSGLYLWVQPVIRYLCAESGNKRLAPLMLAGMESILTTTTTTTTTKTLDREQEWAMENATAVCAAIVLFVAMRVKGLTPQQAMEAEVLVPAKKEILKQLSRARDEVTVKGVDEEALWRGWTDVTPKGFDEAAMRVSDQGWLDADWYRDVAEVMQVDDGVEVETTTTAQVQVQSRRADTMLQERYDLLSETRRGEYKVWREDIMARIAEKMAAAEASNA